MVVRPRSPVKRSEALDEAGGRADVYAAMQRELTYAIAPAGPSDAAALARVHVDAWRETYAGILPRVYLERMSSALHEHRWRQRLLSTREATLAAEGPQGPGRLCFGRALQAIAHRRRGGDHHPLWC